MAFSRIARVDEVPPGQTRFFVHGGRPLLVANYGGRLYAVHGLCPHRGNPLEGAQLWENFVTCPWHNFQYDVRTGENHYPRNVYPPDLPDLQRQLHPLRTYRVEIREGDIWVDL